MATIPDMATQEAAAFLRLMGYRVREVPCNSSKTCDLCAEHASGTIWIEAKRDEVPREDQSRIKAGEAVHWNKDIPVTTKVEDTISHASKQLRSSSPEGQLKFLWYLVMPPNDSARELNILCTLYGVRWFHLTHLPKGARANVGPVFLAGRASFCEHPHIAGVVVQAPGSLKLCANPFFSKNELLASSRFWEVFAKMRAIFDVHCVPRCPDAYFVDLAFAGSGQAEIIRHLQERHGVTARPTAVDATTVAWTGNEMGGLPELPGAGWGRPPLDFVVYLRDSHEPKAHGTQ